MMARAECYMAGRPFFRRKWFLITCGVVLLYTLVGFFLAPALLKSQLESKLPAVLHRNVSVQQVQINPYVLSLRIIDFRVTEPDGRDFASLDEFFINLQLSSLFQRSLNFKEISLKKPAVAIALQQDGKTTFDDLISGGAKEEPPTEPSKPLKVKIEKLHIDEGGVTFTDFTRTPTFETYVHPIHFNLTDFSTHPDSTSPHSFSAHTETGATLSWSGAFSVNPLRSNGLVTVNGIQLKNFSPYYADFARFNVTDGEAALRAEYRLDASSGSLALEIHHGGVEVKQLTLKAPQSEETIVTLSSLMIDEADADLLKRTATVDAVSLSDGAILARRQQDGLVNLLALLSPSSRRSEPSAVPQAEATKTQSGGEKQEPWRLAVKQVMLANFTVTAEDVMPPTQARFVLDRINLKLNDLAFPDRTPIAMDASVRWNQSGTIAANGTLRHSPVFADLHVAVNNFDLRPFQPYIEEQATVELTSGAANLQGHAVYGAQETGAPMLRFTGTFSLDQVAALDTVSSKNVVAWDTLALKGIRADVSPTCRGHR